MRKYALVILDNQDAIINRYNLELVTEPTGNGFELNISILSGDVEDAITKVVQKKNKIKFKVQQIYEAYEKANSLAMWIQRYSTANNRMALEYTDGAGVIRYCEGRVVSLTKDEKSNMQVLEQELEFLQTTPFFEKRENTITIRKSSVGKAYPFTYPYNYGTTIIENNSINNEYILDVPLVITLTGRIANPTISLLDENSVTYNTVSFDGTTIDNGEKLIINSAQKKIIKVSTLGVETDFVNQVDATADTYLRAKNGLSTLLVNIADANDNFTLTGSWRQYIL